MILSPLRPTDVIGDSSELLRLARTREGPCVSVFMPTHRRGPEVQQDATRLKNHLRDVRRECDAIGYSETRVERVVAPMEHLLTDTDFWQHQAEGLAMFVGPAEVVVRSLPYACEDLAIAGSTFHLKPLLPLMTRRGTYLVLALSQNRVRLFEGSRFTVRELRPDGLPDSLAQALWMDDPEKSLQLRTVSAKTGAGGDAMFHGQGAAADVAKRDLTRYFRRVDEALRGYAGGDPAPLVLACVDYYLPIYRDASSYPNVADQVVAGNPDQLSAAELHERSWRIVEPQLAVHERAAEARIREALGSGAGHDDLAEIVAAARTARVEAAFVATDRHRWGRVSADPLEPPELHDARRPGDVDLLDTTAVATLSNGGDVYPRAAREMPGDVDAAAVFRF